MTTTNALSNRLIWVLAFALAVVTANAYYIHPIIGRVATTLDVSAGMVGLIPALNQVALALGVLLLLPLGDRVNNRKLVALCLAVQVFMLVIMAVASNFWLFTGASTLLGFFTITPYLLPAYASKRVEPNRLGFVTAMLATGVIGGIQLSRLVSGVLAEHLSWQAVYWLAASLMTVAAVALPLVMRAAQHEETPNTLSYPQLFVSQFSLMAKAPTVLVSGVIQGINFGIFLLIWLGISLHLTSDAMGHGTDLVGYLTAFSAIGLLTTARLGKVADRLGPERARFYMAVIQFVGIACYSLASTHWQWLLLPLAITNIVGPMIDVTGRMTSLKQPPETRSRIMSGYIATMFVGAGIGSWAGTAAYDAFGWNGTVALALSASCCVTSLSYWQYRRASR
jgi:predicted MFS family arabinose efflux permease